MILLDQNICNTFVKKSETLSSKSIVVLFILLRIILSSILHIYILSTVNELLLFIIWYIYIYIYIYIYKLYTYILYIYIYVVYIYKTLYRLSLYIYNTLYSSRSVNSVNFSCPIFLEQNVLIPPYCIVLTLPQVSYIYGLQIFWISEILCSGNSRGKIALGTRLKPHIPETSRKTAQKKSIFRVTKFKKTILV